MICQYSALSPPRVLETRGLAKCGAGEPGEEEEGSDGAGAQNTSNVKKKSFLETIDELLIVDNTEEEEDGEFKDTQHLMDTIDKLLEESDVDSVDEKQNLGEPIIVEMPTENVKPPAVGERLDKHNCEVCKKSFKSRGKLSSHLINSHFYRKCKTEFLEAGYCFNLICNICLNKCSTTQSLLLHIGSVHRKLNEVLEKENLVAIKF